MIGLSGNHIGPPDPKILQERIEGQRAELRRLNETLEHRHKEWERLTGELTASRADYEILEALYERQRKVLHRLVRASLLSTGSEFAEAVEEGRAVLAADQTH